MLIVFFIYIVWHPGKTLLWSVLLTVAICKTISLWIWCRNTCMDVDQSLLNVTGERYAFDKVYYSEMTDAMPLGVADWRVCVYTHKRFLNRWPIYKGKPAFAVVSCRLKRYLPNVSTLVGSCTLLNKYEVDRLWYWLFTKLNLVFLSCESCGH